MELKKIDASDAPKSLGPYSQCLVARGFVFVSGQLPIDPASGKLVDGDVVAQAKQVFANLEANLKAAGSGLDKIVRLDLFLADIKDFNVVNGVFAQILVHDPKPARQTMQAGALPLGAKIEISCIALAQIPNAFEAAKNINKADLA